MHRIRYANTDQETSVTTGQPTGIFKRPNQESDQMNTELNNLDTIVRTIDYVHRFLNRVDEDSIFDYLTLKSRLDQEYKSSTAKNLEIELRDTFLKMNESILQNNFGAYLFQLVEEKIKPFYFRIMSEYQHEGNQNYETDYPIFIDYNFFRTLHMQSELWIWVIYKYLKLFCPSIYSENFQSIDNTLPKYNDYGEEIFEENFNNDLKPQKFDKTYTKDQILLLNELGVFDLPQIRNLSIGNRGKLFARLLNRHEKNVTDTIRECNDRGNKQAEDNPYIYEKKVQEVRQFLKEIGFTR